MMPQSIDLTASRPLDRQTIETRLHRAIKTLFSVKDPDRRFRAGRPGWPETFDPNDYATHCIARFAPSREDLDRYLDDLDLLKGLPKEDWSVLVSRAFGASYFRMAVNWGRSDEYWRKRYLGIINLATERAG